MKRDHLHLVVNNTFNKDVSSTAKAKINLYDFLIKARNILALVGVVLRAPFRLLVATSRLSVKTGRGFFTAMYYIFLGTIGITLITVIGYGVFRVILYPLFH